MLLSIGRRTALPAEWNVFYFRRMPTPLQLRRPVRARRRQGARPHSRSSIADAARSPTASSTSGRTGSRTRSPTGVQAGDHVGILATNCIEWVEAMFAALQDPRRAGERQLPLRRGGAALPLRQLRPRRARLPAGVRPARRRGPRRAAEAAALRPHRVDDSERRRLARSTRSTSRPRSPRARPSATSAERSDDDIYMLYTGGTTGMPKGVMWRQEDVYYALGGGIDVVHERAASPTPTSASEKIDRRAADGSRRRSCSPPLMHGAGQFDDVSAG